MIPKCEEESCTFKKIHSNCFVVNGLAVCEFIFFKQCSGPYSKCGPKCVAQLPPAFAGGDRERAICKW